MQLQTDFALPEEFELEKSYALKPMVGVDPSISFNRFELIYRRQLAFHLEACESTRFAPMFFLTASCCSTFENPEKIVEKENKIACSCGKTTLPLPGLHSMRALTPYVTWTPNSLQHQAMVGEAWLVAAFDPLEAVLWKREFLEGIENLGFQIYQ